MDKALGLGNRTTSVQFLASAVLSLHKLWFVDTCELTPPKINKQTSWLAIDGRTLQKQNNGDPSRPE